MPSTLTIFISYTSRDTTAVHLVELLEQELLGAQIDVWRDRSRLSSGEIWATEIEKQVETRDATLAVISRSYRASKVCQAEHTLALDAGRLVIPVLLDEGAPMPLRLAPLQVVRADPGDPESVVQNLRGLVVESADDVSYSGRSFPKRVLTKSEFKLLAQHFLREYQALSAESELWLEKLVPIECTPVMDEASADRRSEFRPRMPRRVCLVEF